MPSKNYICSICNINLKKKDDSIQCNLCNNWIHKIKCSKLNEEEFNEFSSGRKKDDDWYCSICCQSSLPFYNLNLNQFNVESLRLSNQISNDLTIIPDENLNNLAINCNLSSDIINMDLKLIDKSDNIEFITPINSKYHDLDYFNNLNHNRISSLNIIHTNLASISKHFDDLSLTLSLLNADFHIIAITEHKIHKDIPPIKNINLIGYYPFHYQPTNTTHGGAGFYIKKSLVFNKRDDLSFNSTGDFETCFIEIIIPNKKNVIVGCI